jgi:hypothetical protein
MSLCVTVGSKYPEIQQQTVSKIASTDTANTVKLALERTLNRNISFLTGR